MENWKDYEDLFDPFEKLVEIEVEGRVLSVPENNNLLRCFQFISLESISMGDFCWNRDCANCQVWIEEGEAERPVLACRTRVEAGMKIVRKADEIQLIVD